MKKKVLIKLYITKKEFEDLKRSRRKNLKILKKKLINFKMISKKWKMKSLIFKKSLIKF